MKKSCFRNSGYINRFYILYDGAGNKKSIFAGNSWYNTGKISVFKWMPEIA